MHYEISESFLIFHTRMTDFLFTGKNSLVGAGLHTINILFITHLLPSPIE